VPANEFVNLGLLGAEGEIDDDQAVYAQDEMRDSLQDFGWLPTRPGALLKTLPVHAPNEIFDTSFRLFALQSPLRIGKNNAAVRLLSDERFVDLDANLEYFLEKYDAILAQDSRLDGLASVRGDPYRRFGRLYKEYIQEEKDDVETMLEHLKGLDYTPATAKLNETSYYP
jgi:hypothetical protein